MNYRGPAGEEDHAEQPAASAKECSQQCSLDGECRYFVHSAGTCYLKRVFTHKEPCDRCTSGLKCMMSSLRSAERLCSLAARNVSSSHHFTLENGSVAYSYSHMHGRSKVYDLRALRRVVTFEDSAERVADLLDMFAELQPSVLRPGDAVVLSELDGLYVFAGRPYPPYAAYSTVDLMYSPVAEVTPLHGVCASAGPDVLAVIDGHDAFFKEWLVLEEVCNPRIVVLQNHNLPHGTGWIRSLLLSKPGWAEVYTGTWLD